MTNEPPRRLLIASDIRASQRGADVYATHPAGTYENFSFWLSLFSEVTVISRDSTDSTITRPLSGVMTGPGVRHAGVPDYSSLSGLIRRLPATLLRVRREVKGHDVVFARLPEPLSLLVAFEAKRQGRKIIAYLVADPATLKPPYRRITGPLLSRLTSFITSRADGVAYVTRRHLQQTYQTRPGGPSLDFPDVGIMDMHGAVKEPPHGRPFRVLSVGTNSRLAKGQDILLEAVVILHQRGHSVRLDLIGGGDHTQWLRDRVEEMGVADYCTVHGHLSDPDGIRDAYRNSDLFCVPSRSEGLPRALIEAMSYGMPAVSTPVGGIPELLPPRQLFPGTDAAGLADTIEALMEPQAYSEASAAALIAARILADRARPSRLLDFVDTSAFPS